MVKLMLFPILSRNIYVIGTRGKATPVLGGAGPHQGYLSVTTTLPKFEGIGGRALLVLYGRRCSVARHAHVPSAQYPNPTSAQIA